MTEALQSNVLIGFFIFFFFTFSEVLFASSTSDCKDFWHTQGLKKTEYLYDYEKHSLLTEEGNEGYEEFSTLIQRGQCLKEWTVFIYMNADNDLTLSSYTDIYEMENLGSSSSVDIIVYHDSNKDTGSRYLHIAEDPSVRHHPVRERRFRPKDFSDFEDSDILSPIVQWFPEQNSGDVNVFEDFLRWGIEHYPSKHVAIIIWSHGMGWEKISFDMASDVGDNSYITIPQLKNSLASVRHDFLNDASFDILGADACLMMMTEVAFELKNEARFLIGSAASEANMGWPYTTILRHIIRSPIGQKQNNEKGVGMDAAYQWAKRIPLLYAKSYAGFPGSSQEKDTKALMVSFHAQEMQLFFPDVLNNFGKALMNYIQEDKKLEGTRYDEIRSTIEKTFVFSGTSQDLYHFTWLINYLLRDQTSKAAQKLRETTHALQDVIAHRIVLSRGVSPYYYEVLSSGATKGISIWLPTSNQEFQKYFDRFKESLLYRDLDHPHQLSSWALFNEYIHSKEGLQGIGKIRRVRPQ